MHSEMYPCPVCGTRFAKYSARINEKKFCTEKCKKKAQSIRRGLKSKIEQALKFPDKKSSQYQVKTLLAQLEHFEKKVNGNN